MIDNVINKKRRTARERRMLDIALKQKNLKPGNKFVFQGKLYKVYVTPSGLWSVRKLPKRIKGR